MGGRACLLAVVAAVALVQRLPALPDFSTWTLGVLASGALALGLLRYKHAGGVWCSVLSVGLCFVLALGWALWRAELRLQDALVSANEDRVARVVLKVAELVREAPASRRFVAQVLSAHPPGVPERIEVAWHGGDFVGPYGPISSSQENPVRKNSRQETQRIAPVQPEPQPNPQPDPPDFPDIVPGQIWRMALNLRRVSGAHNPHGFDYEGHQFARGIRAQGSVRGTPELLAEKSLTSLSLVAEFLRHHIRRTMRPYLQERPYAGVLLALAIGDQASIPPDQWQTFNRSGLTHLVAISGTHITMIAVLGAWLVNALWRRLRWRERACAERVPAQIMAALAALGVAWVYCLLAGWGVPARRTFLMLALAALAYVARVPVRPSYLLCLVAALVVVLDPWALMSSGFWLSFGAVTVLIAWAHWGGQALTPPRPHRYPVVGYGLGRWLRRLRYAAGLQLTISLALLPLLALWFGQLPLASPLTNAYAIPAIGLVVTPLALGLAATASIPGLDWLAWTLAWAAHGVLAVIMPLTHWLAHQPWAVVHVAAAPVLWMGLALGGVCLALLPRGWPLRRWAWLAMLPAFFWRPAALPHGQWRMTVLDVGQAGAVLIQTRNHALLFDTGLRTAPDADAGARLILPFLRSVGVRKLDTLVVSHADIDHVGGLSSLLHALPVAQTWSSFDLPAFVRWEAQRLNLPEPPLPAVSRACTQGTYWQVDGVQFRFLWPPDKAATTQEATTQEATTQAGLQTTTPRSPRNARSCVLHMQGQHHAALLPADIGQAEEARLLQNAQTAHTLQHTDVVLAPHHGSRFSSSASWVAATRAQAVVAQAGRWNRYGHPHPDTVRRWQQGGAWFASTFEQGAVQFDSTPQGLQWRSQRDVRKRYWHGR